MIDEDLVSSAARLVHFGLAVRSRPGQEPEYQQLLDRYLDSSDLRRVVAAMTRGLGLNVVEASVYGLVLAPEADSVFEPGAGERRHASTDDRLLEGLIQVAIAATLFPRPADLADESTLARPPLTIDEVEDNLRALVDKLEDAARRQADPTPDDEAAGLSEAWRAYAQRAAARENRLGGRATRPTRRLVELAFERLVDHGCFVRKDGGSSYHPTWRYQVLVRDLAAMRLFERVQEALSSG